MGEHRTREELIAAGVIRPAHAGRAGDPTEQPWRPEPTLRIDWIGEEEARRERTAPRRERDRR
jgi:hypothetical protein